MIHRFSPFHIQTDSPHTLRLLHTVQGAAQSVTIAQLARTHQGKTCIVTQDSIQAARLETELRYLCQDDPFSVYVFPDRETLPYDHFSPHQDIVSQRLATLKHMQSQEKQIVIVPMNNALVRLTPKTFLHHHVFSIEVGQHYDMEQARQQFIQQGYHLVDHVYEHGEFAIRGAIIDLYPMGAKIPFRIELFDDEIDTIRTFDPETQRSIDQVEHISLLPAKEFPTDAQAIDTFRKNFRQAFTATSKAPESIYQQVTQGIMPAGIEAYLPLFFDHTETLFDYLHPHTQLITLGDLEEVGQQHLKEVKNRFETYNLDKIRPLLPPDALYLSVDEFFAGLKEFNRIHITAEAKKQGEAAEIKALPDLRINHQLKQPLEKLQEFIQKSTETILFCVASKGRAEVLKQLLQSIAIQPQSIEHLHQFNKLNTAGLCVAPLIQGCTFPESHLSLICETELFGLQVSQQRRKEGKSISADLMIRNLAELKSGQAVVHLEHGVGRYQGLEHLSHGGLEAEFLKITYAQDDVLYVPISALHLVHRYSGRQDDEIALNRLGGKQWDKEKKKAAEKITDVAADLLDIYAQRAATKGQKMSIDFDDYQAFAAQFPFEETADQIQTIEAVLDDMQKKQPMDRLICGDVGFGKTEVAMRATFIAVQAGKQVAILVPTTLLAQQHYQNFVDRFADWPVCIDVLSRFKTAKEQKQAIERLHQGKIDIIIGTHKLLQPDLRFDDLGLLIVDEEHRFGVRHKEQIKRLRAQVNILTMTATPIPRTLNMAMSGIRDLSIIATPPAKRLSVKTFVRQKDQHVIKEALLREVLRGGQAYYLHNNIDTIEKCAYDLQELLPEARVVVAHGQMRERELEHIMSDFCQQRYNILVCSTIIETGIDVPTANTIVIERADKFGLAQLHQLRGRVGRSHHQAYAYLLTPHVKNLTKDATKRLEAISTFDDLGVGFLLATQDLEIRGAGDFLGDEQSGHMAKIGFSLYMDMLEEAVESLKEGKAPTLDQLLKEQCEIDLRIPALLPEQYIRDPQTRLSLYKRIASCQDTQELDQLQIEMIDRFGLLPDAAKNLFYLTQCKQKAQALGVKKIELHAQGGSLELNEHHQIDLEFIMNLLQNEPQHYRMDGPTRIKLHMPLPEPTLRIERLTTLIHQLQEHSVGSKS